ncbi:MAG: GNAT family N-acetyltransferase [bacterium]
MTFQYRKSFSVSMKITIRLCERNDLRNLEWFGLFTPHREILRSVFNRHLRGENVMLIADVNNFPIGQVWIDLKKKQRESTGVLWALRVLPWLQKLGIGTRLVMTAEELLRHKGFTWSEMGVEIKNQRARRLYERLGYSPIGRVLEEYSFKTPDGEFTRVQVDQFLMRKQLLSVSKSTQGWQERP